MDLNFKGVPKSAWITIGVVVAFMITMLIVKPEFSQGTLDLITGAIILVLIYTGLRAFGVIKSLFGKKNKDK